MTTLELIVALLTDPGFAIGWFGAAKDHAGDTAAALSSTWGAL